MDFCGRPPQPLKTLYVAAPHFRNKFHANIQKVVSTFSPYSGHFAGHSSQAQRHKPTNRIKFKQAAGKTLILDLIASRVFGPFRWTFAGHSSQAPKLRGRTFSSFDRAARILWDPLFRGQIGINCLILRRVQTLFAEMQSKLMVRILLLHVSMSSEDGPCNAHLFSFPFY